TRARSVTVSPPTRLPSRWSRGGWSRRRRGRPRLRALARPRPPSGALSRYRAGRQGRGGTSDRSVGLPPTRHAHGEGRGPRATGCAARPSIVGGISIAAATSHLKASQKQAPGVHRGENMSLHFDVICVELPIPKVETFGKRACRLKADKLSASKWTTVAP